MEFLELTRQEKIDIINKGGDKKTKLLNAFQKFINDNKDKFTSEEINVIDSYDQSIIEVLGANESIEDIKEFLKDEIAE